MHTSRKIVLEATLVLLVGAGLAVSSGVAGASTPTALQHLSAPVGDASHPVCVSIHRPDSDLKIQVGNFSPPNSC